MQAPATAAGSTTHSDPRIALRNPPSSSVFHSLPGTRETISQESASIPWEKTVQTMLSTTPTTTSAASTIKTCITASSICLACHFLSIDQELFFSMRYRITRERILKASTISRSSRAANVMADS